MAQLFTTVLTPAQFTVANNNTVLSLALGATTIVICTTTQNLTFIGLTATTGNVDGMVVTVQLVNAAGSALSFSHDTSSPASSGFLNRANATITTGTRYGAVTYRYLSSASRWVNIGLA